MGNSLLTGQREEASLGLYYYGARWYDPALGRFIGCPRGADTIVPNPGDAQSFDRYAYALNNPLKYVDPTGHQATCAMDAQNNMQCSDNAVTGGHTLTVDLADEPQSNNPDGTGFFMTMGGLFIGAFAAPLIAPYVAALLPGACADGDCTNEVTAATKVVQQTQSVWQLRPFDRGVAIENMLGRSPFLVQNFPVIDRFENGVATSIKSIDLTAKTYQNLNTLTSTVQGYVDKLANWQGQPTLWGGVRILPSQITGRAVELAIPPNATQAQLNVLQQVQQYATTVGVNLHIIPVP